MPMIMTDFKNDHGHKDIYIDTIRKLLSQEVLTCIIWESPNCNHLEVDQFQVKNNQPY